MKSFVITSATLNGGGIMLLGCPFTCLSEILIIIWAQYLKNQWSNNFKILIVTRLIELINLVDFGDDPNRVKVVWIILQFPQVCHTTWLWFLAIYSLCHLSLCASVCPCTCLIFSLAWYLENEWLSVWRIYMELSFYPADELIIL